MTMRYSSLATLILSLLVVFLVSGCDDEKRELRIYIKHMKHRAPAPVAQLPELKKVKSFTYAPRNKRNPFLPTTIKVAEQAVTHLNRPNSARPKQPLELFPLDALRMVGTLHKNQRTWALILSPDGKVHRIGKGQYLGKNYGKIMNILNESIQLQETVRTAGKWQHRKAQLKLLKDGSKNNY